MSTIPLGAIAKLYGGLSANPTHEFTGTANGTDNITEGFSRDTRRVPGGRGAIATQPGKFVAYDFGFATDSNAGNDAILRRANGQRTYWRFQPDGASGDTHTFEAVCRTTLTMDHETDACVWTVGLMIDGKPNVS